MKLINIIIMLILTGSGLLLSQVPNVINYQGLFRDDQGNLLDGQYSVTINLYDNVFSGTPVWTETQNVGISKGLANVYLGSKTNFFTNGLRFNRPYWLGIKVGNNAEFPKTQLTSVPYSFVAKTIDASNAQEGFVLTYKDSTVKWEKMVGDSLTFVRNVSSDKAMMDLTQTGTGPVMKQTKSTINITDKNTDSPQGVVDDIIETLTGYCAYKISVNSEGSIGIFSEINNKKNTQETFFGVHHGVGRGLSLITDYPENTNYCLYFNNLGKGIGLYARQTGADGTAGHFIIENSNNPASAFVGVSHGTGSAGYFINKNATSTESALVGITEGAGNAISGYVNNNSGHAGSFIIQNPNNAGASVSVYSSGSGAGTALYAKSTGACRAASFESNNNATQPTVYISGKASENVLHVRTEGAGLGALITDTPDRASKDPVFQAQNVSGGVAADFVSTASNNSPTVQISKEGATSNIALKVYGSVDCNGNVSKKGGSFVIDHPLDPDNKELLHSFVESPDMKNIYDGVAVLDKSGAIEITLPEWFEALNRDFRYQLTCIGGYAPVYISQKIKNNKFRIAGGKAGLEVSWQVTGIRHDRWADENRIPVERDKKNVTLKTVIPAIQADDSPKDLNLKSNINIEKIKQISKEIDERKAKDTDIYGRTK